MADLTIGTPRVDFTSGETMLVQVDVRARDYPVAKVPAILNGCLVAEIFEEEKNIRRILKTKMRLTFC